MKYVHKVISGFLCLLLIAGSVSVEAAPAYTPHASAWDRDAFGDEIPGFDGQAYTASRYIPSIRPQVVVGVLALTAILVVYLQNREGTSHHHHGG